MNLLNNANVRIPHGIHQPLTSADAEFSTRDGNTFREINACSRRTADRNISSGNLKRTSRAEKIFLEKKKLTFSKSKQFLDGHDH